MTRTTTLNSKKTLRAVIYTRVNPPKRALGNSRSENRINRQARACEVKAAELGATIVDWYHDEASAGTTHRKGLDHLMERLLSDRDADVVIVDRIATLTRNTVTRADLEGLIRHAGAKLAVSESNASSIDSDLQGPRWLTALIPHDG